MTATVQVQEYADGNARELQEVAQRAWPSTTFHPGGLGWSLATRQLPERVAVFRRGDTVVAWAAVDPPGDLLAQSADASDEVAMAVADWCLSEIRGETARIRLAHGDPLVGGFTASGFAPDPDAGPFYGMSHPATSGDPGLRGDYEVRAVHAGEEAARVEAHRAAWRPADLPWHPDHRPDTPPEAASSYDVATHRRVMETWLYDITLDLVAVAPDGSIAGCCIAWFDETTGVAEIEPLGVSPVHRRRGVAGLLCHAVIERVAARGGTQVFIAAEPREAYPASAAAYSKAGFSLKERGLVYLRS